MGCFRLGTSLGVKKKFKPCPQNRILVPPKDFFKISDWHPRPFYIDLGFPSSSPGKSDAYYQMSVRTRNRKFRLSSWEQTRWGRTRLGVKLV